ncbi:hypothetical protein [Cupriavidus plantarum]
MKLVLEAIAAVDTAAEQDAAIEGLIRIGFVRSSQRLADGA